MAKFDIGWYATMSAANVIGPEDPEEANYEPNPVARIRGHSTLMRGGDVELGTGNRGLQSQAGRNCFRWVAAWLALAVLAPTVGRADPVTMTPDVPPAQGTPPNVHLPPTWDLDGLYLWLGPTGAASHIDAQWDSTFGGSAAVIRVREHDLLAGIGGSLGASRWAVRGGGRVWLDTLVATELAGHMTGLSAGPIVELSDFAHPRAGGSVGLWAFVGVTPFVRVGIVDGLGSFAEIGVHLMLPVLRRRVH